MSEEEFKNKFIYKGCIHIHTVKSDGTGDINAITISARKAGLSFVIITDHNYFDLNEGVYNGVYVIKGEEISPCKENHYLALDIKNHIEETLNPEIYVQEVRTQKGFGFAAHPDESTVRKNSYPPIRWNKKYIPDGVEIWNWFSSWADNLNDRNIFALAYSFLFKNKLVSCPSEDTLSWWDELNRKNEKIVPAIGGVDAHALSITKYIFPVTIFPYKTMFKTINNFLYLDEKLSSDFVVARKQILNAIKEAKNIIVNRKVYDSFPEFFIENKNGIVRVGEKIKLDDKTFLNVKIEKKGVIKVTFDGDKLYEVFDKNCRLLLDNKGKYRVEILINGKGYAYSNPIVVT